MTEQRLIYTVKAFTGDPEGGNAAAVVPQADGLTDDRMQEIARRMGFSETAFVIPSTDDAAAFRLRWFTPTVEVNLCGHATVATLKVLAEESSFATDGSAKKIETLSGLLRVSAVVEGKKQIHRLQVPLPNFEPLEVKEEQLKSLFGFYPSDYMTLWPRVIDDVYPFFPAMGVGSLRKLRPDFARMERESLLNNATFFTGETIELGHTWHCRFFAPCYGIKEDPVTGAINGPLGGYFYEYIDSKKPKRAEYIGEQGDIIGSPGRVLVTVEGDGAKPTGIEIGGEAVITNKLPLDDILPRQ